MTKVKVGSFGWIYIHVVLDWYTKEIVGHSFSFQSKANDWLDALHMAINKQGPTGFEIPRITLNWSQIMAASPPKSNL